MTVSILPPNLMALAYVAHNLREADQAEIFAGAIPGPDTLAMETLRCGDTQWMAWLDEKTPVASWGGHEAWPGVWTVWMYATDLWPRVALSVTKHVRRVVIPALVSRGLHRGQCASSAGHTVAHAWLHSIGFEREGTLRGYGRRGEDFYMYAWRPANVLR